MSVANQVEAVHVNLAGVTELNSEGVLGELPISVLLPADSPRRAGVNDPHAQVLAEADENSLPPILVQASTMRVLDGMHRLRAAEIRGDQTISVHLFYGDDAAAYVAGVEANIRHGLPLSLADREAAAERIIQLFPPWSNRAVATVSGLSDKTVAAIRRRSSVDDPQPNARLGRDGRLRPLDSSDARRRASEMLRNDPSASLRSVAQAVGLAPSTVRDVREKMLRNEDPAARHGRGREGPTGSKGRQRSRTGQDPHENPARILESLKRDPSLRLSDNGRELLRWLDRYAKLPEAYEDIVNRVPSHCAEPLLDLALECSSWWRALASHLEYRRPEAG